MHSFLLLALLPLSLSAQALLECHPSVGRKSFDESINGNIVISENQVIFFQLLPYVRTINFDLTKAEKSFTRTGTWLSLTKEAIDEVVELQYEESGSIRRAYIESRSPDFSEEYFRESISMKCLEQ